MKVYRGSRRITPFIINLGSRWKWVVNFTPRPLYSLGNNPRTRWKEEWTEDRAGVDVLEKRKISWLFRIWTPAGVKKKTRKIKKWRQATTKAATTTTTKTRIKIRQHKQKHWNVWKINVGKNVVMTVYFVFLSSSPTYSDFPFQCRGL
jgi:hypothetical protein